MNRVYLDWAATSIPDPECLDIFHSTASARFGNPSSIHSHGREAKRVLSEARSGVARALECAESEVFFTSGGTESNGIVLLSLLPRLPWSGKGNILVTRFEHPSVFTQAEALESFGYTVRYIGGRAGFVDADELAAAVDDETRLVSAMQVNNETGAVQPIGEIGGLLARRKAEGKTVPWFHVDGVQGIGKVPVSLKKMPVDSFSGSGHKIGAPKGTGILVLRREILPLAAGGGQEGGIRPGTENLPGIAATAFAVERSVRELESRRRHAEKLIDLTRTLLGRNEAAERIRFLRESGDFSPFILSFSVPPLPSETIVRIMDDAGFSVSAGSACASNKKHGKERVLIGSGFDRKLASSAVRISTGPTTTEEEIRGFCDAFGKFVLPLAGQLKGNK